MDTGARIVVVTDLDGTLLDHDSYDPGPARPKVAALQRAGVPVVCCSAKTRAEQQFHRRDLGLTDPFIVENGAAVYDDDGPRHVLGLAYAEVRRRLRAAAARLGVSLRGFGDMDVAEVVRLTNLSPAAAARAQQRDHTEPFLVGAGGVNGVDEATLRAALDDVGLGLQRGARFWTATGRHDKGTAVALLREMYAEAFGQRPVLYGLGDTHNDAALLTAVDVAMLVQRPDGSWADLTRPDHSPADTTRHDHSPAHITGSDHSPADTTGHDHSPADTTRPDHSPADTTGHDHSPADTTGHDTGTLDVTRLDGIGPVGWCRGADAILAAARP